MAIQALYTAATGMKAMDVKLDVVANNLANIETVGFKRSRPNFADILYHTLEHPGQRNGLGQPLPTGKQVGLGVRLASTQLDMNTGAPDITNNKFDLMIAGQGFFQVKAVVDGQEETVYTRAGNFTRNAEGDLVLNNGMGARMEPVINVPEDVKPDSITISRTGEVSGLTAGTDQQTVFGQIELARFVNPVGLVQIGSNLFRKTDASGEPINANPTENGMGNLLQGQLERSNTDPVKELVALIQTQRSFELNSQSLQSADQTLQTLVNITRF